MYTKFTDATYEQTFFNETLDPETSIWDSYSHPKAAQMQSEGKTDNIVYISAARTYRRYWLDEAAALEWQNFCYTTAANLGFVIENFIIGDA